MEQQHTEITLLKIGQMGKTKNQGLKKLAKGTLPYLMVFPAILVLTAFVIFPIGYMVYLSAFDWNMMGDMKFVGFGNFIDLYHTADFWQVVGNTFLYTGLTVGFSVGLSLPLAVYLNRRSRISRFLQNVIFAPYVVSMVSIAFIWMWMMDTDFGLLNYFLSFFGQQPIPWLDSKDTAIYSLVLVSVWKGIGYNTIIFIAAMQTISPHLYEAAKLDKASRWRVFREITLPLISPSVFFLTLMNTIAAFKVFETINVMTKGGPMNSTNTLVFNIYQFAFQFYKIGDASAMGVVLMVLIGICTLFYFRFLGKRVFYR